MKWSLPSPNLGRVRVDVVGGPAVTGPGESAAMVLLTNEGYADLFCLEAALMLSTTLVSTLRAPGLDVLN